MGANTVKLITLPDGNNVLSSSGTVTPNVKAILVTDTQGNPVIHQSGTPKSGSIALMGTDKSGNKIVIFPGDSLDPIVWDFFPDSTGESIYILKPSFANLSDFWVESELVPIIWEINESYYTRLLSELPIRQDILVNDIFMRWSDVAGRRYFGCLYLGQAYVYTKTSQYNVQNIKYRIFRQKYPDSSLLFGDLPPIIDTNPDLIPYDAIRNTHEGAFKSDGLTIWAPMVVNERSAVAYLVDPFVIKVEGYLIGPASIPVDNLAGFPEMGLISITYTYESTPHWHTCQAIYYSKSGNVLNQVYINSLWNEYDGRDYYFFIENYLPITFTHEFESGPFRVTEVKWRGDYRPYFKRDFQLMGIKVDGEVPSEGFMVLVDKDEKKHYGITIYEYKLINGWLTGINGVYLFYLDTTDYYNFCADFYNFCGVLLENTEWVTRTHEMEIEDEYGGTIERQGYIYVLKRNRSYHAIRFYHSFCYQGVQTLLKPNFNDETHQASTEPPSVIRIISTTSNTYVMYIDGSSTRQLKTVSLPTGFYTKSEVFCGRYLNVDNQIIDPPGGYRYLEIVSLGNTVFAYCTNEIYNKPSAIFYSTDGRGWTSLREIKGIPSSIDITNVIRVYSSYSCSFSVPDGDYAFFLIPEQQFIVQGRPSFRRYVNSFYTLYRISKTFEIYSYSLSAPGFPSDPIGSGEDPLLIRTPVPKNAIQMICYDTMEPQPPFEESPFPGSTYLSVRYYIYNDEFTIPSGETTTRMRWIEIPHALMNTVS